MALDRIHGDMGPDTTEDGTPHVIYPVFASHDERTFEIARDVAEGADMRLLVVDLLATDDEVIDESRHVGSSLLASHVDERHDVEAASRYERTDDPVGTVIEIAAEHDTRLIVFDEHTPEPLVSPFGDVPDRISDRVDCDVVSVERTDGRGIDSVLVPVVGGEHTALSVSVAGAIALATDAALELLHVTEPGENGEGAATYFESARQRLPDDLDVETRHLEADDVADAIVAEAAGYDLTVIGEPDHGRLKEFLFGSVTDEISREAANTVLVCRHSEHGRFDL